MKIKIIKPFETGKGRIVKGTILDVGPKVAERWVDQGDAEPVIEAEGGIVADPALAIVGRREPSLPGQTGNKPESSIPATKRKTKNHKGKKVETASLNGGEINDGA